MTNTALLRDYISRSGLKLSFIAEKMGISRASLYEKINNKSAFNQFQIDAICKVIGVNDPTVITSIFFDSDVDK